MVAMFAVASLVMINSQAVDVGTSTSITNAAPTVTSVFVSAAQYGQVDTYSAGTINDLVGGGTRTIHINGVVADNNLQGDIEHVELVFYRSSATAGCTPSNNDCYAVATCDLSTAGVTTLQKKYDCPIDLQYYADSTSAGGEFEAQNWVARVKVFDVGGLNATDSGMTKEVQTLMALTIPSTIAYGGLGLGVSTTAANNQPMSIAQQGNDVTDVEVSMASASMGCTLGTIPRANQQWSLTDIDYNAVGTNALTGSATRAAIQVPYRHGANPSQTLYWNISIPANGVGGSCTGTSVISALAGA